MDNIKRSSLRFNLANEKSCEAWRLLHQIDDFGYTSMQDFIIDAVITYFNWRKNGCVPYKRAELEAEYKRWMRDVLQDYTGTITGSTGEQKPDDFADAEEGEIENSVYDMASDFLSML